jgi:hypothetical protein
MNRLLPAGAAMAVAAVIAAVPMLAIAVTVSVKVEGVVNAGSYYYQAQKGGAGGVSGNLDGQSISFCFTFDPDLANDISTDGSTYRLESSSVDYVSVVVRLADGTVLKSPQAAAGTHHTALYRMYPNPAYTDSIRMYLDGDTFLRDGAIKEHWHVAWLATKTGAQPDIYVSADAGLSYSQPLNLNGATQSGDFNLLGLNKSRATLYQYFGSMTASSTRSVKRC